MPSELIFRAQLVTPDQHRVYDTWCRAAGQSLMPSRKDLLANITFEDQSAVSILHVRDDTDLMQTVFVETNQTTQKVYGEDVIGKSILDLEWGPQKQYWTTVYHKLIKEQKPLQGVTKGSVVHQDHFALFWLRLPVSQDGNTVSEILCHDTLHYLPSQKRASQSSHNQISNYPDTTVVAA